ncbi:hypothetical protein ACQKOH_06505 [Sphingomonas sp. NPDC092331]|jgi:hypothetical protein|uniref:hypothetical protein n=1 Tax=unclassified Sphingomonas TaxID=196159 RepID=UPI0024580A4F|nr:MULTISPECIES: hypothetical protein [unclassified Sphingomonas]MBQ1497256.1 hypothetical protein [Sphingomonas sp.]MDH4743023.1 hypothetical protein [Sphingomonas sp. CBMAI 2297]
MRKKIGFSLSLAAAAGFQAVLAQPLQARPGVAECDNPPSVTCTSYRARGFANYGDCVSYYSDYCPMLESGNGGCVYDPRIGQTICW